MFGDAILVPDHRGRIAGGRRRLAVRVRAYSLGARAAKTRRRRLGRRAMAWLRRRDRGRRRSIVLMKIVPGVPGSFTRAEWIAFAAWSAFGSCSGCRLDERLTAEIAKIAEKNAEKTFLCVLAFSAVS